MPQRLDYLKVIPDGMKALGGVHQYIGKSGLSSELIDLVYLRVSQIMAAPIASTCTPAIS
jgi:hypothetical protein